MNREAKLVILIFIAAAVTGAGFRTVMYFVGHGLTWRTILSELHLLTPGGSSQRIDPTGTDPLKTLRPHPWSSPLHDRNFDNAIAGARAAADAGDYDRAITLNTEALNIHPSEDLVWVLLIRRADCYYNKGDPDKALADFDAAAGLGGLNPDSYINRAFALRQKGKRDEAMRDFEAAIRLDPNGSFAYCNRASAFAEDGDLYNALADYAKALELNPRAHGCRLACAEVYLRQNENEQALMQADVAIRAKAQLTRAHIIKATAYAQMRDYSKALTELNLATNVDSKELPAALNAVAWFRATQPQAAVRDGKKALTEAKKACDLDHSKHWWFIDTLAAASAETGDFENAIKYEKQALAMSPPGKATEKLKARIDLYTQHKPCRKEF